ncbi:MAG: hypothetical protein JW726_18585 [Anaerolineales bacterium]|nr:hypothetical protein [Anaerolineales bacterium]
MPPSLGEDHLTASQPRRSPLGRFWAALGWTRASYYLMSGFVLILFLLGYVWWPLAEEYLSYIPWDGPWWRYLDWLLLGNFLAMSLLIMARADLRADVKIVFVGFCGGLVIEGWGTQTNIWHYYTHERPPLWIIPAWPIASLSIDRLVRLLHEHTPTGHTRAYQIIYWVVFGGFYVLMLYFVAPTFDKSLTQMALLLVALLTLTPTDHRLALLTFAAGSGLGYFLERWGTTRECWIYYTGQTPPLFAVLAHGMAAVAFWRSVRLLEVVLARLRLPRLTGKVSPSADDSAG